MPLTRHLYREDEVLAALQFCAVKGRTQEACFWCLELLESGMAEELLLAMQRIWVVGMGLRGLRWFLAFRNLAGAEDLDAEQCLLLVAQLSKLMRAGRTDITVMTLLEAACDPRANDQPDRVNRVPSEGGSVGDPRKGFVTLALLEGKTLTAWGGIRGMEDAWDILEGVAERKHGMVGKEIVSSLQWLAENDEKNIWPALACVVGVVSLTQKEFQRSWDSEPYLAPLSSDIAGAIMRWQELVGRRRRREYAIPEDCLAWLTQRGRDISVYDSNEKDVMGRLERPNILWGSQFWDNASEEMGGWGAVRSDAETREAFYDTHFPDDCPGEWSRVERAKSHGHGVKQRGAVPDPVRWLKNWFGTMSSAVVWSGIEGVIKGLAARQAEAAASAPWELWKGVGATDVRGWNWTPVAGRVVVPPPPPA